jgi:hypothetical protein
VQAPLAQFSDISKNSLKKSLFGHFAIAGILAKWLNKVFCGMPSLFAILSWGYIQQVYLNLLILSFFINNLKEYVSQYHLNQGL